MILDRFFHLISIRMVKERLGELSAQGFARWQQLPEENNFISEERAVLSFSRHKPTDSTCAVTVIRRLHPPGHAHSSLGANYPACRKSSTLGCHSKTAREKKKDDGSLVEKVWSFPLALGPPSSAPDAAFTHLLD